MQKIDHLFLTITAHDALSLKAQWLSAYENQCNIELRLDYWHEDLLKEASTLAGKYPVRLLLTHRTKTRLNLSEQLKRIDLLLRAHKELKPDFIDCQWPDDLPYLYHFKEKQTPIVLSVHNFEKSSEDPVVLYNQMVQDYPHAYAYKVAQMSENSLQALQCIDSLYSQKRLASIPMGQAGQFLRPLIALQSPLAFACSQGTMPAAPGQMTLSELTQIYHIGKKSSESSIFALIGDPVTQSPGHIVHNEVFKELGIDALYLKCPLLKQEVAAFFNHHFRRLKWRGLSVTMPLKEEILPFLDKCSPDIAKLGAINTIYWQDDLLCGTNTDGLGTIDAIENVKSLQGASLYLCGAGGTAKAIGNQAIAKGAKVTLFNRDPKRGEQAAALLNCTFCPLSDLASLVQQKPPSILVQATSVGMNSNDEPLIDPVLIPKQTLIAELVIKPTPFFKRAMALELECISGLKIWSYQAKWQYHFWFDDLSCSDDALFCAINKALNYRPSI